MDLEGVQGLGMVVVLFPPSPYPVVITGHALGVRNDYDTAPASFEKLSVQSRG